MNCPGYPPPQSCPNPRPNDSPRCSGCEIIRRQHIVEIIGTFLLGARQNREAAERAAAEPSG